MSDSDTSLTDSDISQADSRNRRMRIEQASVITSERENQKSTNTSENNDYSEPNMHRTQHQYMSDDDQNSDSDEIPQTNDNSVRYIKYNQRDKYNPDLFKGSKESPWSKTNTAGWSSYDNSDPYNPYRKKKSKKWIYAIIAIVALIVVWFAGAQYSANQQSTKPQRPRVIKKTVINNVHPKTKPSSQQPNSNQNQGSQNNSQNKNPNNDQNNQLQQDNEKLQAEMQNLKISEGTQKQLLSDFERQSANVRPKIYHTVSFIDHATPTQKLKRSIISWAIQHNFRI